MKLSNPIDGFSPLRYPLGSIGQYFSESPGEYGADKGHMGWDIFRFWGAPVYAMTGGIVWQTDRSEDTSYGNDIRILSSDKTIITVYGHLSEQLVKVGDKVTAGQQIGKMGNTGFVVVEGYARQFWKTVLGLDFDKHPGTHLHINVVPCREIDVYQANPATGSFNLFDGVKVQFTHWNNGYHGCIDPSFFFDIPYAFNRPLKEGMVNDDVLYMQFILKKGGYLGLDEDLRGYFGEKTSKALLACQIAENIAPLDVLKDLKGENVGPASRAMLTRLAHVPINS